jgi:hypothetical protein
MPRVDLGLGEDVGAAVAKGASPYRAIDRVTSLVHGSPEPVRQALRRAVARGWAGLAVLAAVGGLHALASGELGTGAYRAARSAKIALGYYVRDVEPSGTSGVALRATRPASFAR